MTIERDVPCRMRDGVTLYAGVYDTIEWAARLPGANGQVGMYGFS